MQKYKYQPLKIKKNSQCKKVKFGDNNASGNETNRVSVKRCLFTENPSLALENETRAMSKKRAFEKPRQLRMSMPKRLKIIDQHSGKMSINMPNTTKNSMAKNTSPTPEIALPKLELIRFLVHSTTSYAVRSLLSFLSERSKSVEDYHNSPLCREVFGHVSLHFLEQVWHYRIEIMSYYRKLGMYPHIGKRVDICLACDKKGGRCKCPALDPSVFLFVKQSCNVNRFQCDKCKNWPVLSHICYDFFFCKKCDQVYKDAPTYITNPSTYCP